VEVEIEGPEPATLEAGNVVRLTRVKLVRDPTTEVVFVSTPADDGDDRAAVSTDGGTDTDSGGGEAEISAHGDDLVLELSTGRTTSNPTRQCTSGAVGAATSTCSTPTPAPTGS
jgi:hypothetical protein